MIDLSIMETCDSFMCMTVDIGSIILGMGLGGMIMYLAMRQGNKMRGVE